MIRECPLCLQVAGTLFHQTDREYYLCADCSLVFVSPEQFLDENAEKAVYDQHNNNPEDVHYRMFLGRLFNPMQALLPPGQCGLDFGSGPGPTLSIMFGESGHTMQIYDPYYAPDVSVLNQQYDFISTSETVEHLYRPRFELDRLWNCLKSGGLLGIMTKRRHLDSDFPNWHYIRDPTHVCFYALQTFGWLEQHWGATLMVPGPDVVLFRKR